MTNQQIMIEAHKRTKTDMAWQDSQKHLYVRQSYAYLFRLNLLSVYAELKPVFHVTAEMMTDGVVKNCRI